MADSFELVVASRSGEYRVSIGTGLFTRSLSEWGCDVVLADRTFAPMLEAVDLPVVYVDAIEANKTISYGEGLMLGLREAGARRGSRVMAVGGGIVQDLATFATSMFMRGIPWGYVPTTMMSMADSCIGGKSSLNVGHVKNLAGNFHPPEVVAVDPDFIATLRDEDVVSGLAEAVKICFCRGGDAFGRYLELADDFDRGGPECAAPLLSHVLDSKRWFIEVDEFDRKERRLLNFGHTFAHALEPATGFSVGHGVAVAVGMLAAIDLAGSLGRADPAAEDLRAYCRVLLRPVEGLGERLDAIDLDVFERSFRSDKKHTADEFHLILPATGGGAVEEILPAGGRAIEQVVAAMHAAREEIR